MSEGQRPIICRGCGAEIPRNVDACQYCGTTVRDTGPIIVLLIGVAVAVASLGLLVIDQSVEFLPVAVLGILGVSVGGYLIYEQRRRLLEAADRGR